MYVCSQPWPRCTSFPEIEQLSRGGKVLSVSLRCVGNVVPGNWAKPIFVLRQTEAFEGGVHETNVVFDSLVVFIVEALGGLLTDSAIDEVPCHILFDKEEHVETNCCCKKFLCGRIVAVSEVLKGTLEHVPLTKGGRQALDLVRDLVLPNIEEGLALLHDLLLKQFCEGLDLGNLPPEHKVLKGFKVGHARLGRDLTHWALGHLR